MNVYVSFVLNWFSRYRKIRDTSVHQDTAFSYSTCFDFLICDLRRGSL